MCVVLCHDYPLCVSLYCVMITPCVCHCTVQHEKTRRQLEDKLSYSEGIMMQMQKENHKLQEDIARLKSERSRYQNKVLNS